MKVSFWLALLLACCVSKIEAQTGSVPPRLAIVVEDAEAAPAGDVLTAKFSERTDLQLLERAQVEKIYREQALSAANKDYLKLGHVLGADGLLILRLSAETGSPMLNARLVAVKPGISLAQHDYPWPADDPDALAQAIVAQFQTMLPKLAVSARDAIPVSILNLRSAVASAESETLERELTLLLYNRLMNEKVVFVLERRRMELLTDEKERLGPSENSFWNGSFLVDGVIDKQGFGKDQVSLEVLLTPPDKSKTITLNVSGVRTNLADVVNDLGMKILGSVKKEGGLANWNPQAEAGRYFEEAKWMYRWKIFEAAKNAAEAAWALGLQTREVAELRIQAYAESAGSPGICVIDGRHICFGQRLNPLARVAAYASVPDPGKFADLLRATELYRDALRQFPAPDSQMDTICIGQVTNVLDRAGWWLRYYYFDVEARAGQEDKILEAKQLCREIATAIERRPGIVEADTNHVLLETEAKHAAFWVETPEQALGIYRQFLEAGKWPWVRSRFFNASAKEFSALKKHQGYSWSEGGEASVHADLASPCLAGWTWPERKRCPGLWETFIAELCHSPKPLVSLEGQALRCSWSWSDTDFERNLASLQQYALSQFDAVAENDQESQLLADLRTLVDLRLGITAGGWSEGQMREKGQLFAKFESEFSVRIGQKERDIGTLSERKERQTQLEETERYLKIQTNFDLNSFTRVVQVPRFHSNEARVLLPLLADYKSRLTNNVPARRQSVEFFVGDLEQRWQRVISPPPPSTNVVAVIPATNHFTGPAPGHGFPPGPGNPFGPRRPGLPGFFPPVGAMRSDSASSIPPYGELPSNAVAGLLTTSNVLAIHRFWRAPDVTNDDPQAGFAFSETRAPRIGSCCYRDGKLWLEVRYDAIGSKGRADFYGVDLKSFSSQLVEFRDQDFALPNMVYRRAGARPFDVAAHHLYVSLGDAVRRYSFEKRTWEIFAAAGAGKPLCLGGRLFFTSSTSILECAADGSFRVLASSRRRPIISVLDSLESYDPGFLFLDSEATLHACIGNDIYAWAIGSNDWQRVATMPRIDWPASWLFEDGFIARCGNFGGELWGMCGHASTPELLFLQPPPSNIIQSNPRTGEDRRRPHWRNVPPGKTMCLEGNSLWFLVDPSERGPANPMRSLSTQSRMQDVSLVRFEFGQPSGVAIPLRFDMESAGFTSSGVPRLGNGLVLPFAQKWLLQPTPEGLVVALNNAPGFWFIPKAELDGAVAETHSGPLAPHKL